MIQLPTLTDATKMYQSVRLFLFTGPKNTKTHIKRYVAVLRVVPRIHFASFLAPAVLEC